MSKTKIILIIFIICSGLMALLPPHVTAIEECDSPIEPSDIPCAIISTYSFDTACSSNKATIYNSSAFLILDENYSDWENTGRCNITFNISERGSYVINSSDGSSATIIVRGVKMEFLKLSIFSIIFLVSLIFIVMMHIFKEDEGSSIAYGFFSMGLMVIMSSMIFFGFEVINPSQVNLPFDINNLIGIITVLIGLYSAFVSVSLLKSMRIRRSADKKKSDFEVM